MNKIIIFDNNGVLTTNDNEGTYENMAIFLGVPAEEVKSLIEPHVKDLDTGRISQDEFYARVLEDGGFDLPVEDFRKVHLNSYIPKPEMQELAKRLKGRHRIALLTNFGDAFWSMFEKWGLDEVFSREEVFLSAELGMAKPDKEIYEYALDKLGIKADNAVFIDDKSENISTAKSLGMNGLLFDDIESLIESLQDLGVKI